MNDIFILVFFFSSIIISLFFRKFSARVFKPFANSFNACLLLLDVVQHFDQVQRPLLLQRPRSQYLIHCLPLFHFPTHWVSSILAASLNISLELFRSSSCYPSCSFRKDVSVALEGNSISSFVSLNTGPRCSFIIHQVKIKLTSFTVDRFYTVDFLDVI